MNIPQDSWFNPTIYFACKLCRQSTRNVDELILHKRLKHTAEELREIKCIIFEERFLKTESEDALLDSKNFIKEDTSLGNSNTIIISQLPKCKSNTADEYHNVNVGVKGNTQSELTNATNSKIPYIFLKRLSRKEIRSYSKRAPCKNKEDPRTNANTNNSNIPHVNLSQNVKYKPRSESDNAINEGNKNCRNSKSCKQNYAAVPAPDLTDAQISRLIHNEEIVHLSMPFIQINRLPLSNQLKSNCDRNGDKESAGSSHSIGTKRNSQPASSQNSKIKAKLLKRCKITGNDDKTIRKESGDENSDNSSDVNEIQSSKSVLSSLVLVESVEPNIHFDSVKISKTDCLNESQELEDKEFIVASIVVGRDGSEKVQFQATDTPITENNTEETSSAAVAVSTGYHCDIHSKEQLLISSESAENSCPLDAVENGSNELECIFTDEEFRLSSVREHSHDETPSPLYIAEPDKTTSSEKGNPRNDDELSGAVDLHEYLIGDNEGDSGAIIDLSLDKNSDEPLNEEPIHTDEDSSPTEISNIDETVHEICTVLNPQEQEQPTKDPSSTNITGNEENVAENNEDCTVLRVLQSHSIDEISNCVDNENCSAKSTEEGPVITSVLLADPTQCPELGTLGDFNESSQENHATSLTQINIDLDTQENPINSPLPPQQNEVPLATQRASRYSTRTRRNVSKVNYSENQSCLMCNKDFYTIEDLENHEKKCALLKSGGTISLNSKSVSKKNSGFPSFGDKGASESDDIQIIKLKTQKVNPVQDPVNDDDYNSEASNSSDSESDDQNDVVIDDTLKADYNYLLRTNKSAKNPKLNKSHLPSPPISLTEEDLQLPLVTWLQNEKSRYNNVILLDPDPNKLTGQNFAPSTNSDAEIVETTETDFESLLYPITCNLCSLNLNSDADVKNHVRFCWTFNKPNHLYCIRCRLSFAFQYSFNRHIEYKHRRYGTRGNQNNESDDSDSGSESGDFDNVDSSSCCESVSDGESDSKPIYDEEPAFFRDLKQLSFTEWLKKQAEENPENIFRIDPDPLQSSSGSGPGPSRNTNANAADFTISPQNPIKCKLCFSNKFNSDFDARSHIETCWRYNKKGHRYCIKCEKRFDNHGYLQQHNKAKHPKPGDALPAPIKCDVCNKEFSTQSALKEHKKIHSGAPILKNFICEICGSAFRNISVLKQHKLTHVEDRSFKCTLCSRAYKSKRYLDSHSNIHSEKINCTLCAKSFPSNYSLKIHIRTHTGELPFPCTAPDCNLKFATKLSLEAHCAKFHEEMGFKKLSCTVCPRSFLAKNRLALHMLTHSEKKFKCTEVGCTKAFVKKAILQEHLRSHTGETPFQCETCGKAYSRLWSFQKHTRVHTDSHN